MVILVDQRRLMRRPADPSTHSLTEGEVAWLGRAGADVRAIFNAGTTTWRALRDHLAPEASVEVQVNTSSGPLVAR
jgi:hypothetical protein